MIKAINILILGIIFTFFSFIGSASMLTDIFGYVFIGTGIMLIDINDCSFDDPWILLKVIILIVVSFLGKDILTYIILLTIEMIVYYRICDMLADYDKEMLMKQKSLVLMFTIVIVGLCFIINNINYIYYIKPFVILTKLYFIFRILLPIKKVCIKNKKEENDILRLED